LGSTRSSVSAIAAVTAAQSAAVIWSAGSGVAAPSEPSGSVGLPSVIRLIGCPVSSAHEASRPSASSGKPEIGVRWLVCVCQNRLAALSRPIAGTLEGAKPSTMIANRRLTTPELWWTPPLSAMSQWYSSSVTCPGSPKQFGFHMSRIAPPSAGSDSPESHR
jgi:hypothetical protein